jgi:hypothetical protein
VTCASSLTELEVTTVWFPGLRIPIVKAVDVVGTVDVTVAVDVVTDAVVYVVVNGVVVVVVEEDVELMTWLVLD